MYLGFTNHFDLTLQTIPVFYILMSNRLTECYSAVFNFIETNVFKLEPTEFITDFEPSMRKAINTVYPGIALRGCWFHYCRAIKKMAIKLGQCYQSFSMES